MRKLFLLLSSVLILAGCAEQYNIAGSSSVPCLDGRMLYLRVLPSEGVTTTYAATRCIDSCMIMHGRFNFEGDMDSAMMAILYTGTQRVMPVVIENANLDVKVDHITPRVSGGPLNDKLYKFFQKKNRLDNELWELQQRSIRMMSEGYPIVEVNRRMAKKTKQLAKRSDELETRFILENADNVLGPGFFMLLCSQYPTPIMTDQIKRIIDQAPHTFMQHPFVRHYVSEAQRRMQMQPTDPGTHMPKSTLAVDNP